MPYILNGEHIPIAGEPIDRDGALYVPLTKVLESLGGRVRWSGDATIAFAEIGPWTATFAVNAETADVNGTAVPFSAPPSMDRGELYVPLTFFQDAYGYVVRSQGNEITISL